jgi:hypothetical protein
MVGLLSPFLQTISEARGAIGPVFHLINEVCCIEVLTQEDLRSIS